MKTGIISCIILILSFSLPLTLEAGKRFTSVEELKKEIASFLKNRNLDFMEKDIQQVGVDFLINARNELVVLDVYGDSVAACEYVKEVLNYKRVKYKQARQLIRYMVNIRLVRNSTFS
jgi:hypothetical protein